MFTSYNGQQINVYQEQKKKIVFYHPLLLLANSEHKYLCISFVTICTLYNWAHATTLPGRSMNDKRQCDSKGAGPSMRETHALS